MGNLVELTLAGNVDLVDISHCGACVNLRTLDLGDTAVADISVLSSMPKLEELYLMDTEVVDFSPIRHCPRLRKLYLTGNAVKNLAFLDGLTDIEELSLSDTGVTSADLPHLMHLIKLEKLYIQNLDLDRSAVSRLRKLPSLVELCVDEDD